MRPQDEDSNERDDEALPAGGTVAPTPQTSGERFHFSPPVHLLILIIFGGVGLAMGAVTLQTLREWRLAPAAPRPLTLSAAMAIRDPGPATWISLTDARWACDRPLRQPSSSYSYGIVLGPTGQRMVIALPGDATAPCPSGSSGPFRGKLELRNPGDPLPAGVYWEDLSNEHRDGPAWILWTDWTPPGGISGVLMVIFLGVFTLFFLAVAVATLWSLVKDSWALRVPRGPSLQGPLFRLPLSTGESALSFFSIGFGVFQVFTFGWLFFLTLLPNWLGVIIGVLAGLWVLATFGAFVEGWKRRASDLLLGSTGCEIRGGPLHGTQHRWNVLSPDFCKLERHTPAASSDVLADTATLIIKGEIAAISQEPAEDRSLSSIAETLHGVAAHTHKADPDGAAATRRLAVVHCRSCGAPVPPLEKGLCPYCGHDIALPDAVRLQIQAQAAHDRDRADSERLLRRVLRQPSAGRINAFIVLVLPPLLLSWPVAGAVFDEFYQGRHIFRPYHAVALAIAALCGNLALQFLLRGQVAARAAVRIIATHFAARPPSRPGGTPDCRVCGAPLSADPSRLLLLCVYCGAENVTGLNLVPVAAAQAGQAGELRAALVERMRTRRRWRWLSLAALVLLAASALALLPVRGALRARTPAAMASPTQGP